MPTSSLLDVRLGSVEPVIQHLPPDVHSLAAADEAIELADAYLICDGHPLAESQKITLRGACAERADGKWAATRVADFGPRQGTGKNDKIAARELAGLVVWGEKLIIHTAHEFPTANESFLRLVAVFEAWDDLRRMVQSIRYANGEQGITLLPKYGGGRLKYRARTGGSSRGFAKANLVVYDEAQHLAREHVAASGPAKLANPNAQSWYAGSGGLSTSAVAWGMRREAILGTGGRLAYTEATAEVFSIGPSGRILFTAPEDPRDREAWYAAIPGLGRWVDEEGVEALYDELGPELFAREILCVWDAEPGTAGQIIDPDDWAGCIHGEHPPLKAWAIDITPESSAATVAGSDGTHVEVVKHAPGTAWVVPEVLAHRHLVREVVVDPAGPAIQLVTPLEQAGVSVKQVTTAEAKEACQAFLTDVVERRLRHNGQPELDTAAANAAQREVGDGGWLWSRRKSSVDISPLYAATLARWAALSNPPPATAGFVDLSDYLDD